MGNGGTDPYCSPKGTPFNIVMVASLFHCSLPTNNQKLGIFCLVVEGEFRARVEGYTIIYSNV